MSEKEKEEVTGVTESTEEVKESSPPDEDWKAKFEEANKKAHGLESAISAEREKRRLAEQEAEKTRQEKAVSDYNPADVDSVTQVAKQAATQQFEQWQAQERAQKEAQAWEAKLRDGQKKYENIADVVQDQSLPVSDAMASVIKSTDDGLDVLMHLNANRELAAQIAGLPPTQAALEMGRISERLKAQGEARVSNAPDPIEPVGSTASTSKDPDDMTPAEYEAYIREKRGGSVFA